MSIRLLNVMVALIFLKGCSSDMPTTDKPCKDTAKNEKELMKCEVAMVLASANRQALDKVMQAHLDSFKSDSAIWVAVMESCRLLAADPFPAVKTSDEPNDKPLTCKFLKRNYPTLHFSITGKDTKPQEDILSKMAQEPLTVEKVKKEYTIFKSDPKTWMKLIEVCQAKRLAVTGKKEQGDKQLQACKFLEEQHTPLVSWITEKVTPAQTEKIIGQIAEPVKAYLSEVQNRLESIAKENLKTVEQSCKEMGLFCFYGVAAAVQDI